MWELAVYWFKTTFFFGAVSIVLEGALTYFFEDPFPTTNIGDPVSIFWASLVFGSVVTLWRGAKDNGHLGQ